MKKSCLVTLSGLALGGAIIINVPYAWSQAGQPGSGAAPSPGQGKGSESQVQKPTDPPMDGGPRSGSPQSGMTRGESTGMHGRTAGGHQWSKDKVKEVQEALKSNGFDPGTADGVIGPKTNQAIREFQKSKTLQATGRIDERTASALGVDAMNEAGGRSTSTPSSGTDRRGKVGSEPTTPGAPAGSTIDPPSKPTGKE